MWEGMILLMRYLISIGMSNTEVVKTSWHLTEPAIKDMLIYIENTREEDPAKLYEMSLEIAKKHHITID